MQCAVIEFGRNVVGLAGAHSTEFNKDTPHPVICLLDEQRTITDKGGTMRLGAQPAVLDPTARAAECYGQRADSRAASASLRVQQRLSPAVRGPRHAVRRHQSRRRAGRDHRAARAIPGSWPCSSIPSSRASRRPPSRCSPASSAPRSSGTRSAASGSNCANELRHICVSGLACEAHASNDESPHDTRIPPENKPKIIIDEDWKNQAQAEKERLQADLERKQQADLKADEPVPPATFALHISTLATQALMFLGQMPNPLTGEVELHLEQAKHFIDTLQMLQEKTQGNLTPEERQMLEEILHELRLVYVTISSHAAGKA